MQTFAATLAHTGARISEVLAIRAGDLDLEVAEIRIATLKRRREHWRAVPVLEDLIHDLELVHQLRRAQRSARGRRAQLWPVSRVPPTMGAADGNGQRGHEQCSQNAI